MNINTGSFFEATKSCNKERLKKRDNYTYCLDEEASRQVLLIEDVNPKGSNVYNQGEVIKRFKW